MGIYYLHNNKKCFEEYSQEVSPLRGLGTYRFPFLRAPCPGVHQDLFPLKFISWPPLEALGPREVSVYMLLDRQGVRHGWNQLPCSTDLGNRVTMGIQELNHGTDAWK